MGLATPAASPKARASGILTASMPPVSWASAVGSKKAEPPTPRPAPPPEPARAAQQVAAVQNGDSTPASVPAVPVVVVSAPKVRREAQYEPAPNEIMRVTLIKPTSDTKLGIRLAGSERPRIMSLSADGLAAKAGCLQEGDVFLKVNHQPADGHENTTKVLRMATGKIIIDLYRVQLPEKGSEGAAGGEGSERVEGSSQVSEPGLTPTANLDATADADADKSPPARVESAPARPNAWAARSAAPVRAVAEVGKAPSHLAGSPTRAKSSTTSAEPSPSPGASNPSLPSALPTAAPVSTAAATPADATIPATANAPASTLAPVPAPVVPRVPAWSNPSVTAAALGALGPSQPSSTSSAPAAASGAVGMSAASHPTADGAVAALSRGGRQAAGANVNQAGDSAESTKSEGKSGAAPAAGVNELPRKGGKVCGCQPALRTSTMQGRPCTGATAFELTYVSLLPSCVLQRSPM